MIPSVQDRLAVDVADAMALKAGAAGGDKDALRAAAQQFEALMVAQMLKTMRETHFNDEDDPLTGGESMKMYQDLLDQQWAAKMAKGRGLGFADMLVRQMEQNAGLALKADSAGAAGADKPGAAAGKSGGSAVPSAAGSAGLQGGAVSPAVTTGVQTTATTGATTGAQAAAASAAPRAGDRKQRFLEALRPHAEAAEAETGVPARFILAQAALESGWGDREIKDAQGQSSHNLFGIKAGRSWDGAAVETTTTEYRQGLPMKQTQRFRAYADYGEAFTDYANLLKNRYGDAVNAGNDAAGFAKGLADGGYATDPAYAGKLKAVIASVATAGS